MVSSIKYRRWTSSLALTLACPGRGRLAALAHVVENKVEVVYARSDLFERRRPIMDDWEAHLDG